MYIFGMASIDPALLELITELSAAKRNWDQICDLFHIPKNERQKSHVPDQIIERIKTYLTSHIARRSITERETGAAFHTPSPPPLQDPTIINTGTNGVESPDTHEKT